MSQTNALLIGEYQFLLKRLEKTNQTNTDPAFRVSKVIIDRDRRTIRLTKTTTKWRDAFLAVNVSFSHKPASHLVRHQHDIFKRQSTKAASAAHSLVFPAAPPSIEDRAANSGEGINFQALNQVIFPPPSVNGASTE
jgi:hypothetical protein